MKRIACLCLALLFLMVPASAAGTFPDTEGHTYEEAALLLSALGIVEGNENGEFQPDAEVTRAEVASILLRTRGITDATDGEKIFTDVTPAHWAFGNISAAYKMGMVNGMGDGTFEPDSPVAFNEAAKMVVCVLGYGIKADAAGGYPAGYLAQATRLGIVDNISAEATFTRGAMAQMIYNALEVELFETEVFGDDEVYTESEDTLLDYLGLYRKDTKITATAEAALIAPGFELVDDEFVADGEIFLAGESGADKLIGRDVSLYIKDDREAVSETVVAVVDKSKRDAVILNSTDIDSRLAPNTLIDASDDRNRRFVISGADVIYNGEPAALNTANVCPTGGTVTLIYNKDDKIDVVMVEEYQTYVVESVNGEEGYLYFKGMPGFKLELKDPAKTTTFRDVDNGKDVDVKYVIEWDVVSVATSRSGKLVKVVRSLATTSGVVSKIYNDRVVIGENSYKMAKNVNGSGLEQPAVGVSATFYLDYAGNIVAANSADNRDFKYGYLVAAELETEAFDSESKVKLFTEDGEMKFYTLADKVELNGTRVNQETLFAPDANNAVFTAGAVVRQLLRYETNKDKTQITKIETATDYRVNYDDPNRPADYSANHDNQTRLDDFSFDYYIDQDRNVHAATDTWKAMFIAYDKNSFSGRYLVRESTKMFVIPAATADDSEYSIHSTKLDHGADGEVYSNLSFYDVDEDYLIGALVWDVSSTGLTKYPEINNFGVVLGVDEILTEEGDIIKALRLYTKNGEVYIEVDRDQKCWTGVANTNMVNPGKDPYAPKLTSGTRNPDTSMMPMDKLNIGDVVKYSTTSTDTSKAISVAVVYRANYPGNVEFLIDVDKIYPTTHSIDYRGGSLISCGTVKRVGKYGPILSVALSTAVGAPSKVNGAIQKVDRVMPLKGTYIEVDKTKAEVKFITPEELAVGDEVVSVWGGLAQEFLIRYK